MAAQIAATAQPPTMRGPGLLSAPPDPPPPPPCRCTSTGSDQCRSTGEAQAWLAGQCEARHFHQNALVLAQLLCPSGCVFSYFGIASFLRSFLVVEGYERPSEFRGESRPAVNNIPPYITMRVYGKTMSIQCLWMALQPASTNIVFRTVEILAFSEQVAALSWRCHFLRRCIQSFQFEF